MTPAYADLVAPCKWRLALLALALTVFGGAALALALLLGAADPPHAANLVYNAHDGADLLPVAGGGDIQLAALPALSYQAPLTIVAAAANGGAADSAWGLTVQMCDHYGQCQPYSVLVDNRGYVVTQWGDRPPEHVQFAFVRRGAANRVYVHFGTDGSLTFRINDEVFQCGYFFVATASLQAVATYHAPRLVWESIKIYTG